MRAIRGFLAIGYAVAVPLLVAGPARAEEDCWTKVSDTLTEAAEGYDGSVPGARGVSGVVVCRHTGDVMVCLNGPPFGVWRSSDAGKSWTRMDPNLVYGGWIRSYGMRIDNDQPGRLAVFRVYPPGRGSDRNKGSQSAYTLDGGATWHKIARPKFNLFGLAGWTHGMVAWADEPGEVRMVAQNRVRPKIAVSEDGGKTWENLGGKFGGIIGPSPSIEYVRSQPDRWEAWKKRTILGYGLCGKAVLIGHYDRIDRTSDNGETYETVSDANVAAHTPVKFAGKLYWGTTRGVIVSDDCGKTWNLLGSELPDVVKGPFFGSDATAMVVVTKTGVFKTDDAGRNWRKISDLFKVPDAWRKDHPPLWLRTDYAWDHTRDILYVTGLAGSAYKREVK